MINKKIINFNDNLLQLFKGRKRIPHLIEHIPTANAKKQTQIYKCNAIPPSPLPTFTKTNTHKTFTRVLIPALSWYRITPIVTVQHTICSCPNAVGDIPMVRQQRRIIPYQHLSKLIDLMSLFLSHWTLHLVTTRTQGAAQISSYQHLSEPLVLMSFFLSHWTIHLVTIQMWEHRQISPLPASFRAT